MTELTLPSVHLNGTSRAVLTEGYQAAYAKVQEAIRAFQAIEMNGRDYYPQGNDAYYKARTQRDVQIAHLCSVCDYLEAHLMHLGE